MVKSVLAVKHQGLRDWLIQRLSAIFMAVYVIALIFYILYHTDLSFAEWHHLFAQSWMKVATILFIYLLVYHAWVGMWTIYTDYVKPFIIRSLLNLSTFFLLAACFVWGVLIVWSV